MYLTRLRLDPRSATARRDLADPYDMHRTLVRAFVADETAPVPRFLWRLEPGSAWSEPTVLVQSGDEGAWAFLQALPGYLQGVDAVSTKQFDPLHVLRQGARYRFRVVANPTVTRQGKRHGLVGEDAQLAWLGRQGERAGFGVDSALVTHVDTSHSRKGGATVSLLRACFEGVLVVHDVQALAQAMARGIGHGKAFGCGLISIARCG